MKKTLIVVDMQNDFIDMALGTEEAVKIVPKVKEKIAQYVKNGDEIIAVINFAPVKRENYWMQVNEPGVYTEIFSSNAAEFGGEGTVNRGKHRSQEAAGRSYVEMTMHPLTASIWRRISGKRAPRKKKPTDN